MEIYVSKDGAQAGPFAMEEVERMVAAGQYSFTDAGWHQGLKEWVPLSNILPSSQSSTPPPPPVSSKSDAKVIFRKLWGSLYLGLMLVLVLLFLVLTSSRQPGTFLTAALAGIALWNLTSRIRTLTKSKRIIAKIAIVLLVLALLFRDFVQGAQLDGAETVIDQLSEKARQAPGN